MSMDQKAYDLIQQKLNEINKPEDAEVTALNNMYKEALKSITENLSIEEIRAMYSQLVEFNTRVETDAHVQRKRIQLVTSERDNFIHKDFGRLQDLKARLEQSCREIQQNQSQLVEVTSKLPETEKTNRQQMKDKFEQDLKEVRAKISQEEQDAATLEEENIKMKAEVQELLASYESREKEFWDKVKENEEQQKLEGKKYMEKFEQVQTGAQKAIQDRLTIETQQKSLTEKKMKLSMYIGKQKEFLDTFDQSSQTLNKLKTELIKLAFTVKDDKEKYKLSQQRSELADIQVLSLVKKSNEVKDSMVGLEKDKERIRGEILAVQQQLKLKSEQLQQKQQQQ